MKKKVLSLLFACILVVSVLVLAGCKTDDLEVQMNENATKAEADLKAEAEALQKKIDEAKTALETAIATKADKTALETAIADFNTAVEAAKTFATTADTTLKTELTAAIAAAKKEVADSVTALSTKLDAKVTELNALIAANTTNVAALQTAKTSIEADITDLKAKVAALTNTDMSGFATDNEVAAAIANLKSSVEAAQAEALKAYITIETWNGTTEGVIDYLYALEVAYNKIVTVAAGIGEEVVNNVFEVYNDSKVRLYRAIDADSAKEVYTYADSKFTAIQYVVDIAAEYTKVIDNYYDAQKEELEDFLNEAIDDVVAVEFTDVAKLETIKAELATDLANVATKAEVDYATDINDRVDALILAFAAENGYNTTNIAEYNDILADIDAWVDVFKDTVNKDLIDNNDVDAMKADYAEVKAEYEAYVADLADRVDAFVTNYTYNYDVAVAKEIYDLHTEAMAWLANHFVRGFAMPTEEFALIKSFEEGAYTRAKALDAAKINADYYNELVEALYTEINVDDLLFKSEYKTRYEEIEAYVAEWIANYFTNTVYAAEAVEGNANYALLNHKAFADLKAVYEAKFGVITAAIEKVEAAYAAADFVTITTNSGKALDDAEIALAELTNLLVNLDLKTEFEALGLPADMAETLVNNRVVYNALVAERNALYADIKAELNKTYADLVKNTNGIYAAQGLEFYKAKVESFKASVATFNADRNSGVDGFVDATEVEGIFATADLEIAKAEALVAISEAYTDAVYTDNAAGDVAKALADVKAAAEANVLADTVIADIKAEVAEAEADIAEIQAVAAAYNAAIADLNNIVEADVKADILADANESLNKAIKRIKDVNAEAIKVDETYALANAELELAAHVIAEYTKNLTAENVAIMVERYNFYANNSTHLSNASRLEAAKTYVSELFAGVIAA